MADRDALLASMRRLRRRRRFIAAGAGAATAAAAAAPLLAAIWVVVPRATGHTLGGRAAWLILLAAVVVGITRGALQPVSLLACARGIDRALRGTNRPGQSAAGAARASDDCVLAAVALSQAGGAPTPFIAAVIAEAVARVRGVPPGRAVPAAPKAPVVLAVAGVGLLVAVVSLSTTPSTAASVAPASPAIGAAARAARDQLPALRLPAAQLELEQDEARRAVAGGRDAGDAELARLGQQFEQLLTDLGAGTSAADAVARLETLAADARAAADVARAARAAGLAVADAHGVGAEAAAFSETLASPSGTATAAGAAAERLAAAGNGGRAALGHLAGAAAAALAGASFGEPRPEKSGGREGPRRLEGDPAAAPPREVGDPQSVSGDAPAGEQRRLERLRRDLQPPRRDLERTASACRTDPAACQRGAGNAGRAMADLHRQARTAEARARVAEAARQFLDRLRRGGASASEPAGLGPFMRAARGPASGNTGQAGGDEPRFEGGGSASEGTAAAEAPAPARTQATGGEPGTRAGSPAAPAGTASGAAAAATAGAGSSAAAGGRVLGARTPPGALAGKDSPVAIAADGSGPSRAQVIGAAGARGFASAEYRHVFDDYAGAVEESLDATVVPPGRRSLVRRYFQLIRPRTP
ncbi:MAG: hypothetical protein ABUS79_04675 [Pseudomonadota bacterium]